VSKLSMSIRRLLDVVAAAIGLVVLSPLLLVIAALVKLHDGGPVFYKAKRVGKGGALFHLLKFRSMVVNADKTGQMVTTQADSRVTPIGRLLRKTKLDELPQLVNVLIGEMSLVGPRPESPKYVEMYTVEQRRVLNVPPGITSAASLKYRHEEQLLTGPNWEEVYCREVMPAKLDIDLAYLEKRTLLSDFSLVLSTVKSMLN
jgi:lipopolysaccharide/colanic/teichoic acid biosynthesis glycosyltransferase